MVIYSVVVQYSLDSSFSGIGLCQMVHWAISHSIMYIIYATININMLR